MEYIVWNWKSLGSARGHGHLIASEKTAEEKVCSEMWGSEDRVISFFGLGLLPGVKVASLDRNLALGCEVLEGDGCSDGSADFVVVDTGKFPRSVVICEVFLEVDDHVDG
jgi:hypothetical protein